jgi:hypothetical protein
VPTQLGKHFWPEWSLVSGVRVDYLAPTLYLGDVVWTFLFLISNLQFLNPKQIQNSKIKDQNLIKKLKIVVRNKNLWVMAGLVVMNILMAERSEVAIYRWARIIQILITVLSIKYQVLSIRKLLNWVVPIWIVVESWLGLGQVINGGSLGGVWYWLGERRFSLGGIGLAEWQVAGENIIRAYGTFSHPNSMAGFLLVSLLLWRNLQSTNYNLQTSIYKLQFRKIIHWVILWSGVLGIVLSGSRVVWGVGMIILLISNFQFLNPKQIQNYKILIGKVLIGIGVVTLVFSLISVNYRVGDFVRGWDKSSISKRLELVRQAGAMIKTNPLFGVGAGNFLVAQPKFEVEGQGRWRQPVHNIFLLWMSEMGVIVTIFLISNFQFLNPKQIQNSKIKDQKLIRNLKINKNKLIILGIIAVTGAVDHYWLTLPQNWWLMAIILAI